MMEAAKKLFNNPVFIKEQFIRQKSKKKGLFSFLSVWGYPLIALLPLAAYGVTFLYGSFTGLNNLNNCCRASSSLFFTMLPFIQIIYFIFRSTSISFPLFSKEMESRTYGNMLSSLLSPSDIVKGKFLSAIYPLFKELLFSLPIFTAISMYFLWTPFQIFMLYLLTSSLIIFFVLLGIYFSLTSWNSQKAHSRAAFAAGFVLLGTGIIDAALNIFSDKGSALFSMFNPLASVGVISIQGFAQSSVSADSMLSGVNYFIPVICLLFYGAASFLLWNVINFEAAQIPDK